MPDTLKIFKIGARSFVHRHNDLPATDFSISDFEVSIDTKFRILEKDGATRFPYLIPNITVIDMTAAGNPQWTFAIGQQLEAQLRLLNYTPYVLEGGVPGVIYFADGVNTTITGNGSSMDPYIVNVSAGIVPFVPHSFQVIWNDGNPMSFAVPEGFLIRNVSVDRTMLNPDEFTQSAIGNNVVIAGFDLFDGNTIAFFGDQY